MKKSGFKAIPRRKSIAAAIALFALSLGTSACTPSGIKTLDGSYTGSDGSSQLPNQVDWTLATTGDGLLTGTWVSKGEIPRAQLSGKIGYFKNELVLYVQNGTCLGEFRGDFVFDQGDVKGTLKDNSNCPDRIYRFNLKKVDFNKGH